MELLKTRDSWEILKDSGRIRVYKATDTNEHPVVIKLYQLDSWLDRLSFARKQRRLRDFYRSLDDGDSSEHLLVPEFRSAGSTDAGEGWLSYSYVAGEDFRRLHWEQLPEQKALALMTQAGRLLQALHQKAWVHGDFKFGNLLYCEASESVYLLDIEDLHGPASSKKKARDLARFILNGLELSLPDAVLKRFWLSYCDASYCEASANEELRSCTRYWLAKLSRRHQRTYQRSINAEQLTFL